MKKFLTVFASVTLITALNTVLYSQNSVKIMPIGNSITQGWTDGSIPETQMKGYRLDLKNLLQAFGMSVNYVGSQSSGSAYFSDCQHAGIGGSRDQYVGRLLLDGYDERNSVQILTPPRPYLDEYNPDIILLHIGTNDITHEIDLITNQKVTYILDLIDQYEARSGKDVIVFLALIINRKKPWIAGSGYQTTKDWNNAIKALAQARILAGDKLVIVDMENDAGFVYESVDMADNLHPNAAGYSKMANLWYDSIVANYNTTPVLTSIPNQNFNEGTACSALELDNYVTDLQDNDDQITWSYKIIGENHMNISIDPDRKVIANPTDPDWNGKQTVVFTATDKGIQGKYIKSVSDTVDFIVNPVNDDPVFTSEPIISVETNHLYTYTFSATDIDNGDILQFSAVQKPDWLTFYATSKLIAGVPQVAGNYPVTLRVDDGHSLTDQEFTIVVFGQNAIDDNQSDGIQVYPNPATENLYVNITGKDGSYRFIMTDVSGKTILEKPLFLNETSHIDLTNPDLTSGLYIYQIVGEKSIHIGKVFINK